MLLAGFLLLPGATAASAEDGYDLWLRYRPIEAGQLQRYRSHASGIVADCSTPTLRVACDELQRGLSGLLARSIRARRVSLKQVQDGDIVLAERPSMPFSGLGSEGYRIRTDRLSGHQVTIIEANSDIGSLYAVFAYLRMIQTRGDTARVSIADAPSIPVRMLDHWDNLDGTIERGYAGRSLWNWDEAPDHRPAPDRLRARRTPPSELTASSSTTSTPTHASSLQNTFARSLRIADAWRPYGIRIYLSARFSAPRRRSAGLRQPTRSIPGFATWWKAKANEIYRLIPDFGGFLVKANAEGQPGPQTYGRTHADGANMLAEALAPHHGIVLWRAFVYAAAKEDRAKQAYDEFKPLDGKFAPNVNPAGEERADRLPAA